MKVCVARWQEQTSARCQEELAGLEEKVLPLLEEMGGGIAELSDASGWGGMDWASEAWRSWAPAAFPLSAVRLGTLTIDASDLSSAFPRLQPRITVPAIIPFAPGRGLLIKVHGEAKRQAVKALEGTLLRLLAGTPPGKLRFTFIDPVGLGQNVASFLQLADYHESLINGKAWTEPQQVEERLGELTEQMETIIQKYLRNEHRTIEEYNHNAGEIAEPYRVLVVLDFPVNFTEAAIRRLVSIAQHGPRCGVYCFVVMDTDKPLPHGFNLVDLERAVETIAREKDRFVWCDEDFCDCRLELDTPPPKELLDRILQGVGERAREAMRVEVPYSKLLQLAGLTQDRWWQGCADQEVRVPLGPAGAGKLQYLRLGKDMEHQVLVVGRPGSGKSNLMHVLINTLAAVYPPDEVEVYLVDFKQGVEFKPYADVPLPHARVVAIESEREFGLSVLERLDIELQQRGETFRTVGVQDIAEYRQRGLRMPRILLLVDEFQEFFTREDRISRQATLLLDRLVRQGRAFGMHVLLASQTLTGQYTLPRSTVDQMAVRIALQCSEADSRLILADDNPAARLLSRPGEAIYNAASGREEGNSPFQVALLTEKDRLGHLKAVAALAHSRGHTTTPIVFEGHEPARPENCRPLGELLAAEDWPDQRRPAEAWLGEPIAIGPPVRACLRRQSGSHLLVVTREEADGVGVLAAAVLSVSAQRRPEAARFCIVDLTAADSPWADLAEEMAALLPHRIEVRGRRDLQGLLDELIRVLQQRQSDERIKGPELYLVIQGLHRARELRLEEGEWGFAFHTSGEERRPSPSEQFAFLLREGPEAGVHVLTWCDTCANVMRVVNRQGLREFNLRVAGPMSAEDSMALLDEPAAAQLAKPYRMLFIDHDRPGSLQKFRPFALPERAWLRQAADRLRTRLTGG
ncbi:FtsK/SpoIIIE domain-containing protein [Limisphaera sp. VF-2]|uniref:FtsK/SpoIIIE domain-containing protein n=1 Tax=Limisphaera sp. VF-2 TaxID=3400418 RepID=UPI003C19DE96